MKTGRSKINNCLFIATFIIIVLLPVIGRTYWNLSLDGDARYRWIESEGHKTNLNLVGASVRKTFSDDRGDRLILFGLAEAEDNFSDIFLHEIYGQYKGPLGAWNITLGRFGLPWGLLPGFSASRLLYNMPHDSLLGMDVDNGIKLSGILEAFDYAVSLTQGYGPHNTPHDPGHGLGVARVGFTPGDTEEFSIGMSAAWGKSLMAHEKNGEKEMNKDMEKVLQRALGGVDATWYLGRWLGRIELSAGRVDHRSIAAGFAALDYAVFPRLDLNLAVSAEWHGSEYDDEWFIGLTGKPPWFTIRGGYRYAGHRTSKHEVILQLYHLYSLSF